MHFLPGQPVEKNGHHSIGFLAQNTLLLSDTFTYRLGLDTEWTQGYLQQIQYQPTDSPSAFLRGVLPAGQHYDYDVNALSAALHHQLDWQLTPYTKLVSALRFDFIKYSYQSHLLAGNSRDDGSTCGFGGCRYTRPANRDDSFDDISYSVGVHHSVNDYWSGFIKLDRSFRAPHTSELYRLQNGQNIADIEEVTAFQAELGLRFNHPAWFIELALYELEKSDGIYQDSERQYLNGLNTLHRGIEADARWQLSESLNVKVSASYGKHTYLNNPVNGLPLQGKQIDTAPRWLGNLQLNWQSSPSTSLQLELQHMDNYFLEPENTYSYSGHSLVNLRGQWHFSPLWTISARILNLLDTRYAERADFAFGNHRYFIGEPTSLYIQLSYRM